MDIEYYIAAWIAYHEGVAQDCAQWAQEYTQSAKARTKWAREDAKFAQEHEALADYYIGMLRGLK